jgi:hypothetical protein
MFHQRVSMQNKHGGHENDFTAHGYSTWAWLLLSNHCAKARQQINTTTHWMTAISMYQPSGHSASQSIAAIVHSLVSCAAVCSPAGMRTVGFGKMPELLCRASSKSGCQQQQLLVRRGVLTVPVGYIF